MEMMSQCYNWSIYYQRTFSMKDLGEATYILGYRSIEIDREGCSVFHSLHTWLRC